MSIWENSPAAHESKKLRENIKTDVVIVGGGIAGILIAYKLTQNNIDCIVLEQNKIGMGVTHNTTAKITSQHNLIYDRLIRTMGREKAQKYLIANQQAVNQYAELCANIDCDFEEKDAYVYTLSNPSKIEDEVRAVNSLGFKAEFTDKTDLPFSVKGAVKFKNQAQFNPMKFLYAVAKNLKVYENAKAEIISEKKVRTELAEIACDKIVIASHFPFINTHGIYFMKMYQQRSYVLALEGAPDINGMYIDEAENGLSFRSYKEYLLLGGGGHRTGKQGGGYAKLEADTKHFFPNANIYCKWAAQDCMTLDGIPYIGRYSKGTPDMLTATGFNKWGMTSAMAGSDIICDLIMGKDNEFADVFTPQRFSMNKQFFINTVESVSGLCGLSSKRCTHLGCALHYNKQEHTWDCSCHGSRFDSHGNVIDNPAVKKAKLIR